MTDLDRQLDYWDRVGPAKAFSHPVDTERLAAMLRPSARILDVGCGYGRTLELLHAAGFRDLTGADIAPAMLDRARTRVPSAAFHLIDSSGRLPFDDTSFEAALLVSVLTCVPTDEGQRALLGEARRVLKPGGVLFVSDLWLQTDPRNIERYERDGERFGRYGCFALPEGVVVRHHDRSWIDALFAGFDQVMRNDIRVMTMNGNPAAGFEYLGRKAARQPSASGRYSEFRSGVTNKIRRFFVTPL